MAATIAVRRSGARDTLTVTTADHQTGGIAIEDTGASDEFGTAPSAEDGPFDIAGSRFQATSSGRPRGSPEAG